MVIQFATALVFSLCGAAVWAQWGLLLRIPWVNPWAFVSCWSKISGLNVCVSPSRLCVSLSQCLCVSLSLWMFISLSLFIFLSLSVCVCVCVCLALRSVCRFLDEGVSVRVCVPLVSLSLCVSLSMCGYQSRSHGHVSYFLTQATFPSALLEPCLLHPHFLLIMEGMTFQQPWFSVAEGKGQTSLLDRVNSSLQSL